MFWSGDCVPNEVSMRDLSCGSIALRLPFPLAKTLHGFDYHVSYNHTHSLSRHLPKLFSIQPVCGGIASATMIVQSLIIQKNDASMPSCTYLTAVLSAVQMSVILHHYIVIHEKTSNHYTVNV